MEAARETRDLARSRITAERALACGLVKHLHCIVKGRLRDLFVVSLYGVERLLRGGANATFDRAIARFALEALSMALLC